MVRIAESESPHTHILPHRVCVAWSSPNQHVRSSSVRKQLTDGAMLKCFLHLHQASRMQPAWPASQVCGLVLAFMRCKIQYARRRHRDFYKKDYRGFKRKGGCLLGYNIVVAPNQH
jgi:hypothetical protein